jgi:hypothetical protein
MIKRIGYADRRFDRSYIKAASGCWLWTGAKYTVGYGALYHKGRGVVVGAHRFAWERFNGRRVPPGFYVCHHCDVRACVNPEHLFISTPLDNERDKIAKGRRPKVDLHGERNPRARLTLADVRSILSDHRPQRIIAQDYGVSCATIGMIVTGRNWSRALHRAAE